MAFIKKFLKPCLRFKGYVCLVKQKSNIKNKSALRSAIVLAILLLLAPCKVRNHIEETLGIKQTTVSNKNIATNENIDCHSFALSEITKVSSKLSNPILFALVPLKVNGTSYTGRCAAKSVQYSLTANHSRLFVALYILYQNLKIAL